MPGAAAKNTALMTDYKQDIIQIIHEMAKSRSPYEIFADWTHCMALAIANSQAIFFRDEVWHKREEEYKAIASRYSEDDRKKFSEMLGMLSLIMENEISDVLGQIYMESGMGSKITGQFFTPFHISVLSAQAAMAQYIKSNDDRLIKLQEPSCGGGAMIIAAAKVLHDAGIDYQKRLRVIAQDLDWKGVYMCYVQLSLYGIKAKVVQGDTLSDPYDLKKTDPYRILRTPAEAGMLL